MRPRLIATDLDGTLLDGEGRLSTRSARVLGALAAADVEVLFVTARPPRWLDELVPAVSRHGTVVCLNGALVVDAGSGRVLESYPLADALVREVLGDLRAALPGSRFAAERGSGLAVEHEFPARWPVPDATPAAGRLEELLDGATGKLLARCEVADEELVAAGGARSSRVGPCVADSGAPGLAEITAPGVTKAADPRALGRGARDRGRRGLGFRGHAERPGDAALGRAGPAPSRTPTRASSRSPTSSAARTPRTASRPISRRPCCRARLGSCR